MSSSDPLLSVSGNLRATIEGTSYVLGVGNGQF